MGIIKKNKVYDETIAGLIKIKHALNHDCTSEEKFNAIVTSYNSINLTKPELLDYFNKNKRDRNTFFNLNAVITGLIAHFKTTFKIDPKNPLIKTSTVQNVLTEITTKKVSTVDNNSPVAGAPSHAVKRNQPETSQLEHHETEVHEDLPSLYLNTEFSSENPVSSVHALPSLALETQPSNETPIDPPNSEADEVEVSQKDLEAKRDSQSEQLNSSVHTEPTEKENFLDTRLQSLQPINSSWQLLLKKREKFVKKYPLDIVIDTSKPLGALSQFTIEFDNCMQTYLKDGNLEHFKRDGMQVIRNYRNGVLSEHRGCKEVLANLFFAIGTLGIGYLAAALYTQRFNPILVKTDSVEKMDETYDSVMRMS